MHDFVLGASEASHLLVAALVELNGTKQVIALPDSSSISTMQSSVQNWLLQSCRSAVENPELCRAEALHVLLLLFALIAGIIVVACSFTFIREDKEEYITPLCPQLVVRDSELNIRLPLEWEETMEIINTKDRCFCKARRFQQNGTKVSTDWPDPFRLQGSSGVAATVRLMSPLDNVLATVVARDVAVVGQGLALCRAGDEIFGFVEPDGPMRYHVRHRTGVHLLTLVGDFDNIEVTGLNPVGAKVCLFHRKGDECHGWVLQHVDAGLVLCCLLASRLHRKLLAGSAPSPPLALPASVCEPVASNEDAPGAVEAEAVGAATEQEVPGDAGEAALDGRPAAAG